MPALCLPDPPGYRNIPTTPNPTRHASATAASAPANPAPVESRERSIALTEIETAAMWAVKSVVFNDPASEVAPL